MASGWYLSFLLRCETFSWFVLGLWECTSRPVQPYCTKNLTTRFPHTRRHASLCAYVQIHTCTLRRGEKKHVKILSFHSHTHTTKDNKHFFIPVFGMCVRLHVAIRWADGEGRGVEKAFSPSPHFPPVCLYKPRRAK